MIKRTIFMILGLVIAYYVLINYILYSTSSFGSFEVVDKQKSNDKFELIVELIDEDKEQKIEINDKTQIIYGEKYYNFTEDVFENITTHSNYQMSIEKFRFPTSLFKGEYRLKLMYLD
ncbi:hypothetical protein [Oceanobacillus sp. J11TS1]|uniref:hypothetical protein n=1 Tax=Oceanobacillus sp. J11TS1 TaxID=2807191 RepID=UPI001B03B04A|nr:hypothetical protein [Oceanobacillus sp. J11TS1]GIO21426.1 hypothetical protein J11TS1_00070 [Oceanobacillus sp. J11TS1]